MSEIIPFDFEEQAVRVLKRDGEPWFVATDVCRVLEISNPTDAVKRLDDDEFTLDTIEGSHRQTNLVSESGLYALVLTSRKEAARRFRKWITAEVLPAIRRSGRYEAPAAPAASMAPAPFGDDLGTRDWLALIREARILHGQNAARRLWTMSPLPDVSTRPALAADPAEARACLAALSAAEIEGEPLAEWLARGEDDPALNQLGLRLLPQGLFIGNAAPVFGGGRWAGGAHRGPLLSLPGVLRDDAVRTLSGIGMRGILLPFALFAEVAHV